MIVTIDGPAGAGKSTAAKALAQRLGFEFLDTGATYRAVTLAGLIANCDFSNNDAVNDLLKKAIIEMPESGAIVLNGQDVSEKIRQPEVTAVAGKIATNAAIREFLVDLQRKMAADGNFVCEGRDQGTVVFPEATCKFFLTANAEERAQRRYEELQAKGQDASFAEVLQAQQIRDARDEKRDISPLIPAPDAKHIDSSGLTLTQVVDRMEQEVRKCSNV